MADTKYKGAFDYLKKSQEVKEWIEKIINKKYANFPTDLRDGSDLCALMNALSPRSVPSYHLTKAPSRMKQNVSSFLDAAEDYGLEKTHKFGPSDLVEIRNLPAVIDSLNRLMELSGIKKFLIPPVYIKDDEISFADDILHKANELIKTKLKTSDTLKNIQQTRTLSRQISVDIFDTNSPKFIKGIIKAQAWARGHTTRNHYQKLLRQQNYRTNIAKEILDTELVYVSNLERLINQFMKPIQEWNSKKKQLSNESIKTLFSGLEVILGYAQVLKEGLEKSIKNWNGNQTIGNSFSVVVMFLKNYSSYVNSYDDRIEILKEFGKNKKFSEFLTKIERSTNQDFSSLLISPIQRIPRYNLLLAEIIKYTWKEHRDYQNLVQVHTQMREVASKINESKAKFEQRAKVTQLSRIIQKIPEDVHILESYREFIREDVVAEWTPSIDQEKKPKELNIYLFNDIILVAIPKQKQLIFDCSIRISRVFYQEPILRKWTHSMKKDDLSGLLKGKSPINSGSHARFQSVSISFNSLNQISDNKTYSAKGTVELVNSKKETRLKVCFPSPLTALSWVEEFNEQKKELEENEKKTKDSQLESAKRNSHKNLTANLSKTPEERKRAMAELLKKKQDSKKE